MAAGTSIKLASGQVIRSDPQTVYNIAGIGHCTAEEVLIGDYIRFGKRQEKVVSSVTWRTPERRRKNY